VVSDTLSYDPLTPTAFLRRSGAVFRDHVAVVDGLERWTYGELLARSERLAGALASIGVAPGDRVAVLAPNTHVLLEAHYGVPLAGAILVALNLRLAPAELAYMLEHAGATVLLYDESLAGRAREAAGGLPGVRLVGPEEYERLVADSPRVSKPLEDERGLLSINYTSGTTGLPKGVMYHHRGAYLQALAMAHHAALGPESVFLWTLPMFHCNGWCFTWAVTAAGGAHLCVPKVDPDEIWRLIRAEGVTHLNAAPTVLSALAYHAEARPAPLRICTGGAPPSPTLLARLVELGMEVTHLYGLTETFGPVMLCDWHPEWDDLPDERRAVLKARQGVGNVVSCEARVVGPDSQDVPADGATLGEIALRGNNVMLGYYQDPEATERAAPDGWFRTGDLGVLHPDGYVELRDRAKDVIVSGGENIASVEVERAIVSHPAVLEAAVVPAPDARWGERPVAFVKLKEGASATADEIRAHVRERLAGFKVPDQVEFRELPKTSTGKIQKYVLREELWAGWERRIG